MRATDSSGPPERTPRGSFAQTRLWSHSLAAIQSECRQHTGEIAEIDVAVAVAITFGRRLRRGGAEIGEYCREVRQVDYAVVVDVARAAGRAARTRPHLVRAEIDRRIDAIGNAQVG